MASQKDRSYGGEGFGRPSVYKAEFNDLVIELGKEGKSLVAMSAAIGVCRDTLHQWCRTHQDFSDSIDIARVYSQTWWEDIGQKHMLIPGFNAAVWAKSISARFPADWREKTQTEVSGPDGKAIHYKADVSIDPSEAYKRMLGERG